MPPCRIGSSIASSRDIPNWAHDLRDEASRHAASGPAACRHSSSRRVRRAAAPPPPAAPAPSGRAGCPLAPRTSQGRTIARSSRPSSSFFFHAVAAAGGSTKRCSKSAWASRLRPEAVRHLAAALGELGHHLLVQPHVHFRRAVERAGIAELFRELLAGMQAAVEVEQLHKVDD